MQLNFHDDGGKTVLSLTEITKNDSEGWLKACVVFDYMGFSGIFSLHFMLNDVWALIDGLKELNRHLRGRATFMTIEENVELILLGDGLGHIEISGILRPG